MRAILWSLLILSVLGCPRRGTQAYQPPPPPGLAEQMFLAATLGAGDVFDVRVYQDREMSGKYRVSPEGFVDLPLIGRLKVEGLTPSQLTEVVRERLADGYIKNPYVTIFVEQYNSKKVFILGQVQKPGTYTYENNMNVVQAVTLAGGFTQYADKNGTIVTRISEGKEERFLVPVEKISEGLARNFEVKPGDIVFVPESIL
jgi:polysaccharide export outer membrane protein